MSTPVLEIKAVEKQFPGVKALDRVSLSVAEGTIHAILGENGAGKSTLIKIVAGVYSKDAGEILLHGRPCRFTSPMDAFKQGLSVIHQETSLIPKLTVVQNVFLGIEHKRRRVVRTFDTKSMYAAYHGLCEKVGFHIPPDTRVEELSVAQQRIVEIIKALAHENRLIIMDEPTDSLTNTEIARLFEIIRDLKNKGVTTIYITHFLDEVFEIADSATILRDGALIATEPISGLTKETIISMMIGKRIEQQAHRARLSARTELQEALRVEHIRYKSRVIDVSFVAHYGEILGITGVIGAGKTELARVLFGAARPDAGLVAVDGLEVSIRHTWDAMEVGIGMLPENKKTQGLILKHETYKNVSLASLQSVMTGGMVDKHKEIRTAERLKTQLNIKVGDVATQAVYLSGGNQQKVVVAKWFLADPRIIIMDEPTRGIDVGAKQEIFRIMEHLAAEGKCIIFISSEVPEVIQVSSRILVMSKGRMIGEFEEDREQERIVHLMLQGEYGNGNAKN